MNKWIRHSLATASVLTGLTLASGAQAYTLATANCSLNTDGWCLGGSEMTSYLAAITNSANFGPAGTVKTSITVNQLATVNAATLAGAGGFISPWWSDTDSASSIAAVVNFFLGGGDLILLQDDTAHDSIGAALGVPSGGNSNGSLSNGVSPLFIGPFGTATGVSQAGTTGMLSVASILAAHGTVGGLNSAGEATSAYWAEGQFAPGAGALVIIADVDMISNAYGNVSYTPLNGNGIFALNSTTFAITPRAVPEPEASSILLLGLAVLGATRIRASRRKPPAAA